MSLPRSGVNFSSLMELSFKRKRTMRTLALFSVVTLLAFGCASEDGDSTDSQTYDYDVEERVSELGVELGEPPAPTANYVRAVQSGNLVFLAGHGPVKPDGGLMSGKLGRELTVEEGQEAARLTAISLLTSLKAEIGDLNRVQRIVKVTGMVNADLDFTEHSEVVNGCSDFLVEVFEDRGKHARAAVGMGSLPSNIPVEIEMIVEVTQ